MRTLSIIFIVLTITQLSCNSKGNGRSNDGREKVMSSKMESLIQSGDSLYQADIYLEAHKIYDSLMG